MIACSQLQTAQKSPHSGRQMDSLPAFTFDKHFDDFLGDLDQRLYLKDNRRGLKVGLFLHERTFSAYFCDIPPKVGFRRKFCNIPPKAMFRRKLQ